MRLQNAPEVGFKVGKQAHALLFRTGVNRAEVGLRHLIHAIETDDLEFAVIPTWSPPRPELGESGLMPVTTMQPEELQH